MTPAQLTTLKTAINANPTWAAFPLTGDGFYDLARALSQEAVPTFWVWSTNADVGVVRAAVTWANLTPADAPDGTQQWANRSLQCQGKQFNLQNLLLGADTINFALPNILSGFQDALTALPTKADGTNQQAGWTALQLKISRTANILEKLLATGTGTQASPGTMTFQGTIGYVEVQSIMGW